MLGREPAEIVTLQHNDYTGTEMVHPGFGITDQIPERCLYTIPAVAAKCPVKTSQSHISRGPTIHDRTHF